MTDADLAEAITRIEQSITEDTFHAGDVLTIEIDNEVSLDQEYAMYCAACEALYFKRCDFVKVKMRRPVEA